MRTQFKQKAQSVLPPVRPARRWRSSLRTHHLNITQWLLISVSRAATIYYQGRRRRCWETPRRETDWPETSFLLETLPLDRLGTWGSLAPPHPPVQVPGWPGQSWSLSSRAEGSRRTPSGWQLGTEIWKLATVRWQSYGRLQQLKWKSYYNYHGVCVQWFWKGQTLTFNLLSSLTNSGKGYCIVYILLRSILYVYCLVFGSMIYCILY